MNYIKKHFLFLFIVLPILGAEELENASPLLGLPAVLLPEVVRNCDDLCTIRNLLCTCNDIHRIYATYPGTVTEKSIETLFFGIDRVIYESPALCRSLSNTAHFKGLMYYARKYADISSAKNRVIFDVLMNNMSDAQQAHNKLLCETFGIARSLSGYQCEMSIYKKSKNREGLAIAIDMILENQHKMSDNKLKKLFFIAVENNIILSVVEKILNIMVAHNISIANLKGKYGKFTWGKMRCTALETAVKYGYLELVTLLLDHKDINADEIYSALEEAVRGNKEIVELLLTSPKIDVYRGVCTAFMSAIEWPDATPMVHYLLNHPSIDLVAYGGEAFYSIIDKGVYLSRYKNNINALLNCRHINQFNINYSILGKKTYLFYAITQANRGNKASKEYIFLINIIKILLTHQSIDVNRIYNTKTLRPSRFEEGYGFPAANYYYDRETEWTALYCAVHNKNTELVRLLLDQLTIDPNIICDTERKETVLHLAIRRGYTDIIELLCSHPKIDFFMPDKDGINAWGLFVEKARQEKEAKRAKEVAGLEYKYSDSQVIGILGLSLIIGVFVGGLLGRYK